MPASYGIIFLIAALLFPTQECCQALPRQERKLPTNPQFWLICAALFFYVGAESVISILVVKFLLDQFQLTWSNFVLVGLWGNISLGRFILSRIGKRFDTISLVIGLALWPCVFIFLAAFGGATVAVLSFLAVGFGFSGIFSLLIEQGSAIAREGTIGILGTCGSLGATFTTGLVGFIAQRWGFPWGITLAAFMTLAIILSVLLSRQFRKELPGNGGAGRWLKD